MKTTDERQAECRHERIQAREALGLSIDAGIVALHDHTFEFIETTPLDVQAECNALLKTLATVATEVGVDWGFEDFKLTFVHDSGYRSDVEWRLQLWLRAPLAEARQRALQLLDFACIRSRPTKIPGGQGKLVNHGEINFLQEAIRCHGGPERAAGLIGVSTGTLHNWLVFGWRSSEKARRLVTMAGIKVNDFNSLALI